MRMRGRPKREKRDLTEPLLRLSADQAVSRGYLFLPQKPPRIIVVENRRQQGLVLKQTFRNGTTSTKRAFDHSLNLSWIVLWIFIGVTSIVDESMIDQHQMQKRKDLNINIYRVFCGLLLSLIPLILYYVLQTRSATLDQQTITVRNRPFGYGEATHALQDLDQITVIPKTTTAIPGLCDIFAMDHHGKKHLLFGDVHISDCQYILQQVRSYPDLENVKNLLQEDDESPFDVPVVPPNLGDMTLGQAFHF